MSCADSNSVPIMYIPNFVGMTLLVLVRHSISDESCDLYYITTGYKPLPSKMAFYYHLYNQTAFMAIWISGKINKLFHVTWSLVDQLEGKGSRATESHL